MKNEASWWSKVRGFWKRCSVDGDELESQCQFVDELADTFWRTDTSLPDRPTEFQAVEAAREFLDANPTLWNHITIDREELAWSIGELWPGPRSRTTEGAQRE